MGGANEQLWVISLTSSKSIQGCRSVSFSAGALETSQYCYWSPFSTVQSPLCPSAEDEESDAPITGANSAVPLFEAGNHHPSLPIQWQCPQGPCKIATVCQSRQPHNIQSIEEIRANLIPPRSPVAAAELFTTSGTSVTAMDRSTPVSLH